MKKIIGFVLVFSTLAVAGVALAANATNNNPAITAKPQYTPTQQTCIKAAQAKRLAAAKTAADALNAATGDATKIKNDAIKAASQTMIAATKSALETKMAALKLAQKNKDAAGIKAANDTYNNNPAVKAAKTAYSAAAKAANDAYNKVSGVKEAMVPYVAAVKAANETYQKNLKACLQVAKKTQSPIDILGAAISDPFTKLMDFFFNHK